MIFTKKSQNRKANCCYLGYITLFYPGTLLSFPLSLAFSFGEWSSRLRAFQLWKMLPYQGLIVVAVVAFLVELITFVANRYFTNPAESYEERRLSFEARRLRAEAKTLEGSPATFMEFAKVGREAAACEKRADDLKVVRESRKNTPAGQMAARVTYFLFPVSMIFAYFFWSSFVSEMEPVMRIPDVSWVWPMAHMLALPNQPPNGAVSSIGWMWVSRRVFARLLDLAIPA